jgi:hypothetical protein
MAQRDRVVPQLSAALDPAARCTIVPKSLLQ